MKSSFLRVLFVVLFVCGAITVSAQKQTEGKSSVFIDYFAHPSSSEPVIRSSALFSADSRSSRSV